MTQQLLKIRGLKIEGKSDEIWNPIVNGIDLDLKKGEVLGLANLGLVNLQLGWPLWGLPEMAVGSLADWLSLLGLIWLQLRLQ